MTQLVPVTSSKPTLAKRETALSPSLQLQRLQPKQVIDLLDRTIYTFYRTNLDHPVENGKSRPKDLATITLIRSTNRIQFSYHPFKNGNRAEGEVSDQIIMDLPLADLPRAIQDLIDAGFGPRNHPDSGVKPSVPQLSAAPSQPQLQSPASPSWPETPMLLPPNPLL
jgi:hypothetical protein